MAAIRAKPEKGWGKRAADVVWRLANDVAVGDFVWTRDMDGRYWLCRVTGPYRYDDSSDAARVDVHQVRDVCNGHRRRSTTWRFRVA